MADPAKLKTRFKRITINITTRQHEILQHNFKGTREMSVAIRQALDAWIKMKHQAAQEARQRAADEKARLNKEE